MSRRRVAITGLGILSPVGNDPASFWEALIAGRSGIAPITRFDCADQRVRIAGEVRGFDPESCLDRKEVRRNDPFVHYAVHAAQQAYTAAGLHAAGPDPDRVGVIFGSGIGGIQTLETQSLTLVERGPGRISPFFVPMMIIDMCAGMVSMKLGARGPNYTTVSACASAAHAIGEAARKIQYDEADVMVTGGAEAGVTRLSVAGFSAARALSMRNDDPAGASRPFDANRDGFVLGEGAGVLILEAWDHARARGAHVHAEFLGMGFTADAHHVTDMAPGGEGAARAMRLALRDAALQPEDVGYVNAHGTSTVLGDESEAAALRQVFGDHVDDLAVSSTKSMTGHLLGAAGAIEAVACVQALEHGVLPPTINYQTPDPACDLDVVPNQARPAPVRHVLNNSFGFGGHNATLAFGHAD